MDTRAEPRTDTMALTEVEFQVLRHIRKNPGLSRTEIASTLNLSKSMLTKAVSKFDELKLIVEEQVVLENGERGKPPILLSPRADAFHSIGVYVNRQICAVVRADLTGQSVFRSLVTFSHQPGIDDVLQEVAKAVHANAVPIIGIGHAVPAIIADNGRLFEVTPTQAALPFADIAASLRSQFNLPVYWENDAFCSATYEANFLKQNGSCVFYTAFGFGVGGGLVFNGSIFRGAYNQAANIGGLIPETGPRPSVTDLANYLGCELGDLSEAHLLNLFEAGRLNEWIDDRGARLSQPLSVAVQFFNPDTIIVGGFFPRRALQALVDRVVLDVYDVPSRRPLTKPVISVAERLGPLGTAEAASLLPVSARLLGQRALLAP